MARRRKIRGSRGPIIILIVVGIVGTIALWAGQWIQEAFMEGVRDEFSLRPVKDKRLPPNPVDAKPQMN